MAQSQYPCEHPVPIEEEPRHHLVIANEFVRAFAVEIAPHDRTLCHHHAHEYLMYVAGDASIVSAPRDGEPQRHTYRDGDCELSPPGLVHVVENLSDTKFRNLLVELVGATRVSHAGGMVRTSGDVNVSQRFGDGRLSVLVMELQSGSQVEVSGAAVVASPYEHEVELAISQSRRALSQAIHRLNLDRIRCTGDAAQQRSGPRQGCIDRSG